MPSDQRQSRRKSHQVILRVEDAGDLRYPLARAGGFKSLSESVSQLGDHDALNSFSITTPVASGQEIPALRR